MIRIIIDKSYNSIIRTRSYRLLRGSVMSELLNNATTGVNFIPTVLLGLILLYWITIIIGAIDIDLFDIDIDIELEGGDNSSAFYAILAFLNVAELPFMLVFSVIILNFWILAMFMYYLPIEAGGLVNGLLLIPALAISLLITKIVTMPLKGMFRYSNMEYEGGGEVIGQLCTLLCDVKEGRLGQANIENNDASIVINVKVEFEEESFEKGEVAVVYRKDTDKNLYYIIKSLGEIKEEKYE